MATGRPPIDPFNPIVECMLKEFEEWVAPDGGLDSYHANLAGRAYNNGFKRPYVCALMADAMTGRWQMGTSQDEISKRLGILSDRAWVSRALHAGKMSMDVYMRLRCWPLRPEDWEPAVDRLAGDMGRSGFIEAARAFAELVTAVPTLVPQRLNELNYELICEVFARLETWLPAFVAGDADAAASLVNDVCEDRRRNVCPSWYTPRQHQETDSEIRRLTKKPGAAFDRLKELQSGWLVVFVGTDAMLEQE